MSKEEKVQEYSGVRQSEIICDDYYSHEGDSRNTSRKNINVKLANPLAGFSKQELRVKGREYAIEHSLTNEEDLRAFEVGAILAQNPDGFEECQDISTTEMEILRKEFTDRWSQPKLLYLIIVLCSTCAAVQGMGK